MGRLVVQRIALFNFGSWEAGELELGGRGPVAVVGPNGSGKSTLASKALVWCLYGKAAPERMGSATRALGGKGLVREGITGKGIARVCIELADEEGHEYAIERSRTRTGSESITVARSRAFIGSDQGAVDALIGADYDVFCRTVIRGQGDVWSFAEAPDGRKREILDALSGAARFGEWHELARAQRAELQGQRAVLQSRADDVARRLGDDTGDLGQRAEGWERDRTRKQAESEAEIAALMDQIRAIASAAGVAEAMRLKRAELKARRPTLDTAPYDAVLRPVEAEFTRLDRERAAVEAEHRRLAAIKVGAECSSCGQVVRPDAPVARKQAEVTQRAADADQAAHQAAEELRAAKEAKKGAEDWLRAAVAAWEGELAALGPEQAAAPVAALEQAVKAAKARLAELRGAENPWKAADAAREMAQARLRAEAEAAQESLALLARDEAALDALIEAYSPKGVRASLSRATLAAIESAANRWLDVLSAGTMSIEFEPERETQAGATKIEIATTVRMRTDTGLVERDLLQLSGGQRVRVNFAVDLGVAACFARGGSLALSLLVLDEAVFSNLDDAGKASMVQTIHHAGVADVVVIDHDARISDAMPRAVRIEMKEGKSQIVRMA